MDLDIYKIMEEIHNDISSGNLICLVIRIML